jgi:hypothetical protein
MSTNTTTKSSKSTKAVKVERETAVVDQRAWVENEERPAPKMTTVSMDYVVRDALWAYGQEIGSKSYNDTIQSLLEELGYEF